MSTFLKLRSVQFTMCCCGQMLIRLFFFFKKLKSYELQIQTKDSLTKCVIDVQNYCNHRFGALAFFNMFVYFSCPLSVVSRRAAGRYCWTLEWAWNRAGFFFQKTAPLSCRVRGLGNWKWFIKLHWQWVPSQAVIIIEQWSALCVRACVHVKFCVCLGFVRRCSQ